MNLHLSAPAGPVRQAAIKITGSKSESNRVLLLRALYPNLAIENLSDSDDSIAMQKGLLVKEGVVDVHHAGTAMRFLTAYHATQPGNEVILTGSERMQERPVRILVEALHHLGARITYLKETGYPPIRISGTSLSKTRVSLPASVSSQYISALMLVAPRLKHGLGLELTGQITSLPYIEMTLGLLHRIGVMATFEDSFIKIYPEQTVPDTTLVVESDWSSASYHYSIAALSAPGTEIVLGSYQENSLQGDRVVADLYRDFGVETRFGTNEVTLVKSANRMPAEIVTDLTHAPDLAQTIAVTCFGLGIACHLRGLHTLKIKETDRLEALKTELTKLGADISVTDKALTLKKAETIHDGVTIETYNDHRMAMAFAPLALKTSLFVRDAEVVSKSYPGFWNDLELLQFRVKEK